MRPPLETYVRCTLEFDGHTYEPAVEWRDDDFDDTVWLLRLFAQSVGYAAMNADPMTRARAIGERIADLWPDRAYFVEVWQNGSEGFAQCVQPYGFPRNTRELP